MYGLFPVTFTLAHPQMKKHTPQMEEQSLKTLNRS